MPIYTRTGDTGETSLFGGKRVKKSDPLVSVYGSIDELNGWIGLVGANIQDVPLKNFLQDIQADLLHIGGILAGWQGDLGELQVCAEDMEVWIDQMEAQLPALHNFILPGGSQAAAFAHITRSVCRRVERQIVQFFHENPASFHTSEANFKLIIKYINRLSDLFFELARYINKGVGVTDITWKGIKGGKK